jgi:TolB protein
VEKRSDTTLEKLTGGYTWVRCIAVAEMASGKNAVFRSIPSKNSYYTTWSPDGDRLLFSLWQNQAWDLGLINSDGTDFRVLKKAVQGEVTCYSPIFARDGESIFCQNMWNIYQFGLDGAVLAQWEIEKIVPNGDMSSDSRIDISPDGRRLLLTIDMATEMPNREAVWIGPVNALWSFDLKSQNAVRVTPKHLLGLDGVWIDNDNILFLGRAVGQKDNSIYRMSTNGKNLKRLIKNAENARFPSVSTQ